jgi:hypothetical protein
MGIRGRNRFVRWMVTAVAAVALPLAACQPTPSDTPTGDGLTSPNAGASCWGIKQAFPASADGIYWVLTPTLDRPLQVYCDMTTAGGGWVLVARGREGWSFKPGGQSTPGNVRTNVDGSAAFAPAALSTDLVVGLLNGTAVNSLADGIRVERATNSTGTNRQEMRLFSAQARWTWSFPVGQKLTGIRINATNYANCNTRDTSPVFYDYPPCGLQGQSTGTNRLRTLASQSNSWIQGWGFGNNVSGGNTNATNFLYNNGGYVLPFTRVWLRPQILNSSVTYPTLPTQGFAADPNPPGLKNTTEPAPWEWWA